MKITIIAGARPNFMKIAPIIQAIENKKAQGISVNYRLIHTGQHYDKNLSATFFEELGIPKPDRNLNVHSGSQAEQTGAIMVGFEKELKENQTDLVLVVGDVTSTMACTIVAKKAGVKVAHVEAGIRSGDMNMPEEINRMVTDSITDYFYTTSKNASEKLIQLGNAKENIFFVGNVMIDTLKKNLPKLLKPKAWDDLSLISGNYFVLTLHRPSNVDSMDSFSELLHLIVKKSNGLPIVFPVHPRTQKILEKSKLTFKNLHYISPLGYLSFIYLVKNAKAILTDSGGITEEASILNIPCITFRDSTERPETCSLGTNVIVGKDHGKINEAFVKLDRNEWKNAQEIPLWDGNSSSRIIDSILNIYGAE